MKIKNRSKSVIIYRGDELLAQFPSLKQAAYFMRTELGRSRIPWSIINKGIHDNASYTHAKGNIYRFSQWSNQEYQCNLKTKNQMKNEISLPKKNIYTRLELINFLSKHLNQIIDLKLQINDQRLKQHHLSSKGLGDDLFYLTESYHRQKGLYNGKYSMTDFVTPKALQILQLKEKKKLIFEHMIPKNLYLNTLASKAHQGILTYEEINNVLMKYYYTCTVTEEEDNLLPSTKMQEGWDEQNPFFRYQLTEIKFIENPKIY